VRKLESKVAAFFIIPLIMILASCTTDNPILGCTKEYMPVCCDGKTYPNICYAEREKAVGCTEGTCLGSCEKNPDIACTEEFDPYCCSGVQYGNMCEARKDCAQNCVPGSCEGEGLQEKCANSGRICTMEYRPVCCDGKTYGNNCVASTNCAVNCVEGEC
jgi:hypothetical protein